MDVHEQTYFADFKNHLTPSLGLDGEWRSSGGLALQESLRLGSRVGALEVFKGMDAHEGAACLREVGFNVAEGAVALGFDAMFESVRENFDAALDARVDGFGLAKREIMAAQRSAAGTKPASKEQELGGFAGAAKAIQRVMRADAVRIDLLGNRKTSERNAVLFVGAEALQKRVQGFAFEGIPGKFELKASLPEMSDVYRESARAVGEESIRIAMGAWASGAKVPQIHEWVPDSVQKMLHGSVSIEAGTNLLNALKSGAIGRHAGGYGLHGFATLLAEQGYDLNAKTVAMQAEEMGLVIVDPDRQRSLYVGKLVGSDHRAGLVKFNRKNVVELPYAELPDGMTKPSMGDRVRMEFRNNVMSVSVAPSMERPSIGR